MSGSQRKSFDSLNFSENGTVFAWTSAVAICAHVGIYWYRSSPDRALDWADLLIGVFALIVAAGMVGWCAKNKSLIMISAFYMELVSVLCMAVSFFFLFFLLSHLFIDEWTADRSHRAFGWLVPFLRERYSTFALGLRVYIVTTIAFAAVHAILHKAADDGWRLATEIELSLPVSTTSERRITINPALLASYETGLPYSSPSPTEPPPPYRPSCKQ